MKTIVQLKVRKARIKDFIDNDTGKIIPGNIYILRSLRDLSFCRMRSTLGESFVENEFRSQLREDMVYVQQVVKEEAPALDSTSLNIPVRIATVHDFAFNKAEFKKGIVFFLEEETGTLSRRMKRIGNDTHFGEFTRFIQEKRIYVQESNFKSRIEINVSAFAKAEIPQAS
jgi:hypothetical protein